MNNNDSGLCLFVADIVLQLGFYCRPNGGSFNPEGAGQSRIFLFNVLNTNVVGAECKHVGWPDEKEDDLNPTDDGESSEESHGASDETQLGLRLDLFVSLDVVKGGRIKVDLHQLESWGW